MKDIIERFKVTDGEKFSLKDYETDWCGDYDKDKTDDTLADLINKPLIYNQHCMPTTGMHY